MLLDEKRPDDILTMVRIAGCQLHRERFEEALATIKKIERKLFDGTPPGRTDIIKEADRCVQERKYVRAVIFLHMACKFHRLRDTESDKYRVLEEALIKIDEISEKVGSDENGITQDYRKIFCNLIVKLAPDIEQGMASLTLQEGSINEDKKVMVRVRFIGNQCDCLYYLAEYTTALSLYKRGLRRLQAHFRNNVKELRVHAEFLRNIGSTYFKLNDTDGAKSHLERALKASEEATDYDTPEQKESCVQKTRRLLELVYQAQNNGQ